MNTYCMQVGVKSREQKSVVPGQKKILAEIDLYDEEKEKASLYFLNTLFWTDTAWSSYVFTFIA